MTAERRVRPARRCKVFTPVRTGCLLLTFGAMNSIMLLGRGTPSSSSDFIRMRNLHNHPSVANSADAEGGEAPSPHQPSTLPPPPPPTPLHPLLRNLTSDRRTTSMLKPAACLEVVRGYWTYEVCLDEEVRQFHSYVRGVDRHQLRSLGRLVTPPPLPAAAPSKDRDADEQEELDAAEKEDLRQEAAAEAATRTTSATSATSAATTPDATPPVFERRRYAGGDRCEPSKALRQSTVSVYCGRSDRVVDVQEPEPCHYELRVELASACTPPPGEAVAQDHDEPRRSPPTNGERQAVLVRDQDANEEEIARKVAARAESQSAGVGLLAVTFRTPA